MKTPIFSYGGNAALPFLFFLQSSNYILQKSSSFGVIFQLPFFFQLSVAFLTPIF